MSSKRKVVKQIMTPLERKTPRSVNIADSNQVIFHFGSFDQVGPFGGSECNTKISFFGDKLKSYQTMKWSEVMNKPHCGAKEVSILEKEAAIRLEHLQLLEESIYQLDFGNAKRLWGFKDNNVFICLWWDPEHKIYPCALKGDDRRKLNRRKGRG